MQHMSKSRTVVELTQELETLYRVAQTVYSLDIDAVLSQIVQITSEITQADSCLVYILDHTHKKLVLRASKNPHPSLIKTLSMDMNEGITGWVATQKQPVVIESGAHNDSRFKYFSSLPEDRYDAFLSVPILSLRGIVGVINIQHRKPHAYDSACINMLTAIGKLVGGAVEIALLVEETMSLKESLELRKILDRSKNILMRRRNISEDEAYRILQKESMDTRKSLKEVCDAILLGEKLLGVDK
jgi:uroporphyrinogen-III synthase